MISYSDRPADESVAKSYEFGPDGSQTVSWSVFRILGLALVILIVGGTGWYFLTLPISVLLSPTNLVFMGLLVVGLGLGVLMILTFGPGATGGTIRATGFALDFRHGRCVTQEWSDPKLLLKLTEVSYKGKVTYELRLRQLRFPNMTNAPGTFCLDLLAEARKRGLEIRTHSYNKMGVQIVDNDVTRGRPRGSAFRSDS